MKKVQFIRHAKLEKQYSDYSKLMFNELCDLATKRIDPNINKKSTSTVLKKELLKKINNIDLILCSQSLRTKQTAKLIKKTFKLQKVIIKPTKNLNEIYFDPKALITKKVVGYGFKEIREFLFKGMLNNCGADSVNFTFERIKNLEQELKHYSQKNILCITHSFYMRVLRIYFLEKIRASESINEQMFKNSTDHDYLKGFKTHI